MLMPEVGPIFRALLRQRSAFWLLVLEAAMGYVVLNGLFLAGGWYRDVGHTPIGYDYADLLVVNSQTPAASWDAQAALAAARARQARELAIVRAAPGVRAATPINYTLMDNFWTFPSRVSRPGGAGKDTRAEMVAFQTISGPAIEQVMDLPLEAGALWSEIATDERRAGVLVTRCVARKLFGSSAAAVGQTLVLDDGGPIRIIGVLDSLLWRIPFTLAADCLVFRIGETGDERENKYLVRAHPGKREEALLALRQALSPPPGGRVIAEAFEPGELRYRRISSGIVTIVVILGVMLGAVALTGALAVSSFLVAQRTRQIGVRRALGATRLDIVRYFVAENMLCTKLGVLLGLLASLALMGPMRGTFPGLEPRPLSFVLSAVLVLVAGAIAALLPARRAARIPPSAATRSI